MTRARLVLGLSAGFVLAAPHAAAAQSPAPESNRREAFIQQAVTTSAAGGAPLSSLAGPGPEYDAALAHLMGRFRSAGANALWDALLLPGVENRALLSQAGHANVSDVEQIGQGNTAVVDLAGAGNLLSARQVGVHNILGVWIRGARNRLDVLQHGDRNQYFLFFEGDRLDHAVTQVGDGHQLIQTGQGTQPWSVEQSGPAMEVRIQHHSPDGDEQENDLE